MLGEHTARKVLTLALSCIALAWAVLILPASSTIDEFRLLKSQLLKSETFSDKELARGVDTANGQIQRDCDSDTQVALLLMEMRVAEASLRSGDVAGFDQRAGSIESRAKRTLSCAPRQSFVWLIAFSVAILHGQLDNRSFDLLALSYDTSPNEAWIAIRRDYVAVPVVQLLPQALAEKVLMEFQQLIRNGFAEDASRSFSRASTPIRRLLQERVAQLDEPLQTEFWKAVQKSGS